MAMQRHPRPPLPRGAPYDRPRQPLPANTGSPPQHPLQSTLTQIQLEVRAVAGKISRLQDEQSNMAKKLDAVAKSIEEQARSSFKIDKSNFLVQLNEEVTNAFCQSLKRNLSKEELAAIISRVLKEEAKQKYKIDKAKAYILHRFTQIRSEERRRLFGIKPCEPFLTMTTDEFAERFGETLKSSTESIEVYKKNVSVMRKFISETGLESQKNTHQCFRKWLVSKFAQGIPSAEELQQMQEEDAQIDYSSCQVQVDGIVENFDYLADGEADVDDEQY